MKNITKEQENFLNKCTNGTWKLNTETGLVDIDGNFDCSSMGLSDFLGIEFGDISLNFNCSKNKLVSLKGAPKKVMNYFYSDRNKLVSLEGAPQEVCGGFYCSNNNLVSLYGSPKYVGGNFHCYNNKLVSLEGSPQKVGGTFSCPNNQLVSLEGAPIEVMGDFHCFNNKLVSLEDAPQKVLEDFICDPINLRGCPINLLAKISFYEEGESIILKNYVRETIDGLEPEIYLKKMV